MHIHLHQQRGGPKTTRKSTVRSGLLVVVLLAACGGDFDPSRYTRCSSSDECVSGWVCVLPEGTCVRVGESRDAAGPADTSEGDAPLTPPDDTAEPADTAAADDDGTVAADSLSEEPDIATVDVDAGDVGSITDDVADEEVSEVGATDVDDVASDVGGDTTAPPCDGVSGPPGCDDGDPCTSDTCVPFDACKHDPIVGCCATSSDCPDAPSCFKSECNSGTCATIPAPGDDCDDGESCTYGDECDVTGECKGMPRPAGWRCTPTGQVCADVVCSESGSCGVQPWPECKWGKTPENECFRVIEVESPLDWFGAQALCHAGGQHVAQVRNPSSAGYIGTIAKGNCDSTAATDAIWIALIDLKANQVLLSPAGSSGFIPKWADGEPTIQEDCAGEAVAVMASNLGSGTWFTACAKDLLATCVVCESRHSAACHDENACTSNPPCIEGDGIDCADSIPLDCDDGNPATADSCDPIAGCVHE